MFQQRCPSGFDAHAVDAVARIDGAWGWPLDGRGGDRYSK